MGRTLPLLSQRSIVLCRCTTWLPTSGEERRLTDFRNRALEGVFGCKGSGGNNRKTEKTMC